MRILGLDPGSRAFGVGVIDVQPRTPPLFVAAETLTAPASWHRFRRLASLTSDLAAVLREYAPDWIAVEAGVSFPGRVRSSLVVGEARGLALAVAFSCGVDPARVVEVAPAAVKAGVGAGGRAEKAEVARAVSRILGLRRAPGPDAADALAVALAAPDPRRVTARKSRG